MEGLVLACQLAWEICTGLYHLLLVRCEHKDSLWNHHHFNSCFLNMGEQEMNAPRNIPAPRMPTLTNHQVTQDWLVWGLPIPNRTPITTWHPANSEGKLPGFPLVWMTNHYPTCICSQFTKGLPGWFLWIFFHLHQLTSSGRFVVSFRD